MLVKYQTAKDIFRNKNIGAYMQLVEYNQQMFDYYDLVVSEMLKQSAMQDDLSLITKELIINGLNEKRNPADVAEALMT